MRKPLTEELRVIEGLQKRNESLKEKNISLQKHNDALKEYIVLLESTVDDVYRKHGGVPENGHAYLQFRPKGTDYTDHDDLENKDWAAASGDDGSISDTSESDDPGRELCDPSQRLKVCHVNVQGHLHEHLYIYSSRMEGSCFMGIPESFGLHL